jgi:hypothetical protein
MIPSAVLDSPVTKFIRGNRMSEQSGEIYEVFSELAPIDPELAGVFMARHSSPGWLTRPYYDKGHAEGFAEGKAYIEAKVMADALTQLLEKRFGVIPGVIRLGIYAADLASVGTWLERALDASDLQSVFDANLNPTESTNPSAHGTGANRSPPLES